MTNYCIAGAGVALSVLGTFLLLRHYVAVLKSDLRLRAELLLLLIDQQSLLIRRKASLNADCTAGVAVRVAEAENTIVSYLETHRDELQNQAERLRAHAQQMHDETQARLHGRQAPARGK